jgi:hypothetical protein
MALVASRFWLGKSLLPNDFDVMTKKQTVSDKDLHNPLFGNKAR